jgi:hypothetical protein
VPQAAEASRGVAKPIRYPGPEERLRETLADAARKITRLSPIEAMTVSSERVSSGRDR